MRTLAFITILFLGGFLSYGQSSKWSNSLKMQLINPAVSSQEQTILVKGKINELKTYKSRYSYRFNYCSADVASITCSLNELARLLELNLISYAELIQPHTKPMNDTMVIRNRIKAVKQGAVPLNQAYNGEGVLMGIIDTGIDFNHPDFKDAQGNSRIKYLWDQTAVSTSAIPVPFNYGTEWTDAQINLSQCTHSDVAYWGHGTGVSGTAAGNGLANTHHQGCASKSDLIVVALDFNKSGPTIADAVQYIFSKASALGKPCVINASLGDYYGSHDGTDLQSKLIESQLKNIPGRAMVAAAGNAGGLKYHVKTQTQTTDSVFTWLQSSANGLEYWMYGDTLQIKNTKISVGANRANYTNLGAIGFKNYSYGLTNVKSDTLFHNGSRIGIIKNSSSINADGVYELYLQIQADTSGLFWRIETTGQGTHDAWNFDFVSDPLPTTTQYPNISNYVLADTLSTMVSGFQCSDEVTTVGNYLNLRYYYDVYDTLRNNGGTPGIFAPSSSQGPTRDGRIKPDICASGNFIFSAMVLSMQASQIANNPTSVAQGSMHTLGGGTSASSPVVAGLAALYLQRHPTATSADVRNAITSCAYSDVFTGNNLPNNIWGHGKLDGLATMTCNENMVGIYTENPSMQTNCFPNPFKDKTTVRFEKNIRGTILIYSMEGKLLLEEKMNGNSYEIISQKMNNNYSGLLIAKIISEKEVTVLKLIKE